MKADILALVDSLSLTQADSAMVLRYYDEIIDDLSRDEILTNVELIGVNALDSTYEIPATANELLGVFHGDRFLNRSTRQGVETFQGIDWRNRSAAQPFAYVEEHEPKRAFRLFPVPTLASGDFNFAGFGAPFGLDYPARAVVTLVTERRDNIPSWLDLPVAFEILAREFARESDHQDVGFAQVCKEAAGLFFSMVI